MIEGEELEREGYHHHCAAAVRLHQTKIQPAGKAWTVAAGQPFFAYNPAAPIFGASQ